jgi:hypothetical protein
LDELFQLSVFYFSITTQMQRAEMEELRQREANLTALQAIGVRKKPRLDLAGTTGSFNQVRT